MHTTPATPLPPPAGRTGAGGHPRPAARAELTPDEAAADAIGSYYAAIQAIGEDVRAGRRPLPEFMQAKKEPQ